MLFISRRLCRYFFPLTAFPLVFAASAFSKEPSLPVLKAKQALDNIRFLSQDGKFTYYQRRSGDLQLSTNYSNELVLQGPEMSEYTITSSPARAKILISQDVSFHTLMSHHKKKKIFVADFGGHKVQELASGIDPRLHLKDTYFSFYLPKEKKIVAQSLSAGASDLSVKLNNPVNPFYLPQVFLLTPQDMIYSDLNSEGHEGFLLYSGANKKVQTIYKSIYPGAKVEACLGDGTLFIGEFDRGSGSQGSRIIKMPLYNNKDFQNFEVLYQSQQGDIGNMICGKDQLFFVKTLSYNQELNLKETEVAVMDLASSKVKVLSNLKHVTQLFEMDGTILAPLRGKRYLVQGKADLANDEIKKLEAQ